MGEELEQPYKQLAANYSFTTFDWPLGSSTLPSRHLQEIVSRWSRSPWKIEPTGRLLFSAVVDTSYLPFAHMFVSSLEHLHYEKSDILLLCASEACFEWYFFTAYSACSSTMKIAGIASAATLAP